MSFARKIILAAFILVAAPFNIQAECNCREPGEEPRMPCAYCDAYEMEYCRIEIKSYLEVVQTYMQCLGECIDEANAKAENVINEWNSRIEQYSNR